VTGAVLRREAEFAVNIAGQYFITRRAANLSPAAQALYNLIREQSLPAA
jgi:hypothetical protein